MHRIRAQIQSEYSANIDNDPWSQVKRRLFRRRKSNESATVNQQDTEGAFSSGALRHSHEVSKPVVQVQDVELGDRIGEIHESDSTHESGQVTPNSDVVSDDGSVGAATQQLDSNDGRQKPSHFTFGSQIRVIFFSTWVKMFTLPFVPAGFAVNYSNSHPVTIFVVNFVAIIALTLMISEAAGELMLRTGEAVGALINMTFSNAVQFVTSIFLLRDNQIAILQTTLIGSILSSQHLMLGLAFLCGGFNRYQQSFNVTVGQVFANLLLLSMSALILPTIGQHLADLKPAGAIKLSRGIAVILIIVYACYLFFQLKSHASLYYQRSEKTPKRESSKSVRKFRAKVPAKYRGGNAAELPPQSEDDDENEEAKTPQLSLLTVILILVVCTVLLGFNAAFATDNLDGLMSHANISTTFVGIVILPLLSNDFTIIQPAQDDDLDLVVGLTVGKCIQTILLITPFTVLLGWAMNREMTLTFDAFEVTALYASVVYISSMIQRGKSHWLDGVMLCSVFLIICLTSYWV